MPRDGSNVYSKASASFVPLQVASSAAVNADFDDLVTDANTPRAIVMGGTGQSTPLGAHDAFVAAGNVVASAATLAIDAVVGPLIDISGVAAVTAVTLAAGKLRIARATGAFTLTASASLVVNRSTTVNYVAQSGDLIIFEGYAAGVVSAWVVGAGAATAISTVASAGTTPIGAAATAEVNITGTTTITAFDTVAAGTVREGYFSGALTLTHNAVSLILPGGANIITAANDRFRALSLGGGNWIVLSFTRALAPILNVAVVKTQTFTASGTYTPDANMVYCEIEVVGSGGGGGGVTGLGSGIQASGGGGGGSYAWLVASKATIGASQVVTIGAAGIAGAAGDNNGGNGADCSVGALCIGKGGQGGNFAHSGVQSGAGGLGGVAGTGTVLIPGQRGATGMNATITTISSVSADGGSSMKGVGGRGTFFQAAGAAAPNYGGGGSGAVQNGSISTLAGGAGAPGIVIIKEFCSA